jgi:predicted MFS family arabinose efflux permease
MLEMFLRVPRDKVASASTIWNASIDSGTGIGSMVLGVVATSFGFVGAFIGGAALLIIGLLAEVYERVTKKQHER